jgi:hypothetical protein
MNDVLVGGMAAWRHTTSNERDNMKSDGNRSLMTKNCDSIRTELALNQNEETLIDY